MLETTFENCISGYPLPELKAQLELTDPFPIMQLKLLNEEGGWCEGSLTLQSASTSGVSEVAKHLAN